MRLHQGLPRGSFAVPRSFDQLCVVQSRLPVCCRLLCMLHRKLRFGSHARNSSQLGNDLPAGTGNGAVV
jgi:hypothetical protein